MHGRCVHCGKRELKEGRDRGSYNECAFLRRRRRHTQARGGGDLSIKFIGGDLGRGEMMRGTRANFFSLFPSHPFLFFSALTNPHFFIKGRNFRPEGGEEEEDPLEWPRAAAAEARRRRRRGDKRGDGPPQFEGRGRGRKRRRRRRRKEARRGGEGPR